MKKSIIKLTAMLATTLTCFSVPANAAVLHEDNVIGADVPTDDCKERIAEGIANVPQEVVDLHRLKGGTITYKAGNLGDPHYTDADGLFYYKGPKVNEIYVRVNNQNMAVGGVGVEGHTLVHEFGHFIYETWNKSMTPEDNTTLQKLYDYWSQYMHSCYDLNETFAERYKVFRVWPDHSPQEEKDFFAKAEQFIIDRYNSFTEVDGEVGYGPGFVKELQ